MPGQPLNYGRRFSNAAVIRALGDHNPDDFLARPEARFALAYSRLAGEDDRRAAWLDENSRTPDPDEFDEEPTCKVCGGPASINPVNGRRALVCGKCCAEGWRAAPCLRCGGVTHKRDRASKARMGVLYGVCGPCREEIRSNLPHQGERAA